MYFKYYEGARRIHEVQKAMSIILSYALSLFIWAVTHIFRFSKHKGYSFPFLKKKQSIN